MELLNNLDKLHTTESGIVRIKRNLSLDADDVVAWCKNKISSAHANITREGKNWYVAVDGCIITVNAHSYTIITAHKLKNGDGKRKLAFDYKKEYKEFYMPKNKPGIVKVPPMNYIAVRGKGDPNACTSVPMMMSPLPFKGCTIL